MMADSRNEEAEQQQSRFSLWTALTGFSIVVLADVASSTSHDTSQERWAMSVACISLSLGALAMLAHGLARERFVATPIEGGLITLCLGFWSAGLPSIMNPKNGIAVYGVLNGQLAEANIYFFSWASFASSLLLAGSFTREVVQVQLPQGMARRSLWWYGLCATSLIVMSSASRTFHQADCKDNELFSDECKRVKFGVALGVVSGAVALLMGSVSHLLHVAVESVVAAAMMILWCFGVGFVTFGSKAPAKTVGNFYFSTWISFIITLFLSSDSMVAAYRKLRGEENNAQPTPKPEHQPQV